MQVLRICGSGIAMALGKQVAIAFNTRMVVLRVAVAPPIYIYIHIHIHQRRRTMEASAPVVGGIRYL